MADANVKIRLSADGKQVRDEIKLIDKELHKLGEDSGILKDSGLNPPDFSSSDTSDSQQRTRDRLSTLIYRELVSSRRELQNLNKVLPELKSVISDVKGSSSSGGSRGSSGGGGTPPSGSPSSSNDSNDNSPLNNEFLEKLRGLFQGAQQKLQFAENLWNSRGMRTARHVYNVADSWADRDLQRQMSARRTFATVSDSTDYSQMARNANSIGKKLGYSWEQTLPAMKENINQAGYVGQAEYTRDTSAILGMSRAYELDPTRIASFSGKLSGEGVFKPGDQQKLANAFAKGVEESGMKGREEQYLSITESLSENLASRNPTVTADSLAGVMGMYNTIVRGNENLKGQRGGSIANQMIDFANNNITTGLGLYAGYGTTYTGWQGELDLAEMAASNSPQYYKNAVENIKKWYSAESLMTTQNIDRYYEQATGHKLLSDEEKQNLSEQQQEALKKTRRESLSKDERNKIAELTQEEMLTYHFYHQTGDIGRAKTMAKAAFNMEDSKMFSEEGQEEGKKGIFDRLKTWFDSDASSINEQRITWQEKQDDVGESLNDIKAILSDIYNAMPSGLQTGLAVAGGLGVGTMLSGGSSILGGLGNLTSILGGAGGILSGLGGLASGALSGLGGVASAAAPFAVPLAIAGGALYAGYNAVQNFSNDNYEGLSENVGELGGLLGGAKAGAAIGTMFGGPIGTAIGALLGGAGGYFLGGSASKGIYNTFFGENEEIPRAENTPEKSETQKQLERQSEHTKSVSDNLTKSQGLSSEESEVIAKETSHLDSSTDSILALANGNTQPKFDESAQEYWANTTRETRESTPPEESSGGLLDWLDNLLFSKTEAAVYHPSEDLSQGNPLSTDVNKDFTKPLINTERLEKETSRLKSDEENTNATIENTIAIDELNDRLAQGNWNGAGAGGTGAGKEKKEESTSFLSMIAKKLGISGLFGGGTSSGGSSGGGILGGTNSSHGSNRLVNQNSNRPSSGTAKFGNVGDYDLDSLMKDIDSGDVDLPGLPGGKIALAESLWQQKYHPENAVSVDVLYGQMDYEGGRANLEDKGSWQYEDKNFWGMHYDPIMEGRKGVSEDTAGVGATTGRTFAKFNSYEDAFKAKYDIFYAPGAQGKINTPEEYANNLHRPDMPAYSTTGAEHYAAGLRAGTDRWNQNFNVDAVSKYRRQQSASGGNNSQYLFNQADDRWGGMYYSQGNMARVGCTPTATAMMASMVQGREITPDIVGSDFYSINGSLDQWVGNVAHYENANADQQAEAYSSLQQGKPVYIYFNESDLNQSLGNPYTPYKHAMVLTGVNQDGTVNINDPNGAQQHTDSWENLMRFSPDLHVYQGQMPQSHGHGLKEVPYDLYPAQLHKGERVLTRMEANELRDLPGLVLPNIMKIDDENDSITDIKYKRGLQEQYQDLTSRTNTNLYFNAPQYATGVAEVGGAASGGQYVLKPGDAGYDTQQEALARRAQQVQAIAQAELAYQQSSFYRPSSPEYQKRLDDYYKNQRLGGDPTLIKAYEDSKAEVEKEKQRILQQQQVKQETPIPKQETPQPSTTTTTTFDRATYSYNLRAYKQLTGNSNIPAEVANYLRSHSVQDAYKKFGIPKTAEEGTKPVTEETTPTETTPQPIKTPPTAEILNPTPPYVNTESTVSKDTPSVQNNKPILPTVTPIPKDGESIQEDTPKKSGFNLGNIFGMVSKGLGYLNKWGILKGDKYQKISGGLGKVFNFLGGALGAGKNPIQSLLGNNPISKLLGKWFGSKKDKSDVPKEDTPIAPDISKGEEVPKDTQPSMTIENYKDENGTEVEAFVPTDSENTDKKKEPGGLLGWYRKKVLGTAEDTLDRWKGKKKGEETSKVPDKGEEVPKGEEKPAETPKDTTSTETPKDMEKLKEGKKPFKPSKMTQQILQMELERVKKGGFNPHAHDNEPVQGKDTSIFSEDDGEGDTGILDKLGLGKILGGDNPIGKLLGGLFKGGNPISKLLGGLFKGENPIANLLGGLFGKTEETTEEAIPKDENTPIATDIPKGEEVPKDENTPMSEDSQPTDSENTDKKKEPGGLLGWYRKKVLGTAKDTLDRWKGKKSDIPKNTPEIDAEEPPKADVTQSLTSEISPSFSDSEGSSGGSGEMNGEITVHLEINLKGLENLTPENQTIIANSFKDNQDKYVDAVHKAFGTTTKFMGRS